MKHVVTNPSPSFRTASGSLEIHQVPAWEDNLVWVLVCTKTGAAAAVDGPDANGALEAAKKLGVTLTHVLNTHTHMDHIGINQDLGTRGLLDQMQVFGPQKVAKDVPGLTRGVSEGDVVEFGANKARVMLTEGHIEGHICFLFEDVLFCGDTLFTAGCGRVFTGNYVAMQDGLSRIAQLDPNTRICCAHEYTQDGLRFALSVEPENVALLERTKVVSALREAGGCAVPSWLHEELATNPMLRWDSAELRANVRRQMPDADLSSPAAVFTATRKLKDTGAYKRA